MAYDDVHSNHSSYNLAVNMLNHYSDTRGIAKEKLVLGVPFYGYQGDTYIAYKNILAQNPTAWNTDYINGTSYNGINTIKSKAELSKEYGGIMIWELSQDAAGEHSLLKAIKEVLFG